MKTLLCLALVFGSRAFGANPVLRIQSIPHPATASPIAPDLIQGIAGIGQQVNGVGLPCFGCFGAPAGTIALPPAYSVVNPLSEPGVVIYYYVVETGTISGTATSTADLIEANTGRVWQHMSAQIPLPANSTSLLGWENGGVPDHDGYKGTDILVFTTTLGSSTVQGRVYLWMQ